MKGLNQKNISAPSSPQKQSRQPQATSGNGGPEVSGTDPARTISILCNVINVGGGVMDGKTVHPQEADKRRWKKDNPTQSGKEYPINQ